MTREEAIRLLKSYLDEEIHTRGCIDAHRMAIKALEQEPYEKFKSAKDHICKLAGDYKCWDNRLTSDEALELYHILEQESVLDKIRVEILRKSYNGFELGAGFRDGYNTAMVRVLDIVDKYKAESEEV